MLLGVNEVCEVCNGGSNSCNGGLLPLELDHTPEFLLVKAKNDLRETAEIRTRTLLELKQKITGDKSMCQVDFHDDFLLQFLRHSKYKTEKALEKLRNHTSVHTKYDGILIGSIADDLITSQVAKNFVTILPKRCPDGCVIVYCKIGRWNPDLLPFEAFRQVVVMYFTQLARDPSTQIAGFKSIYDFKGTSTKALKYCTPQNLYLLYNMAFRCLPSRWTKVHIINESVAMKIIWVFLTKILSTKMKNRILFHSKVEELEEYFPRCLLLPEYGGGVSYEEESLNWLLKGNRNHHQMSVGGLPNLY